MATSNFLYNNRCIVVTNDDYEFDNIPPMGGCDYNSNRNYPSHFLAVSDDFHFWNIVLTHGYYEHACIDYYRDEDSDGVEYWIGASFYFDNKKQFFEDCKQNLHLTEYRLRKVCGNVKDYNNDFEAWLESAYEKLNDYLANIEEKKVNQYLDGVKQLYGYEEVKVMWRASNGETAYQKIS